MEWILGTFAGAVFVGLVARWRKTSCLESASEEELEAYLIAVKTKRIIAEDARQVAREEVTKLGHN